jgi:signal transduction histidine kinase
MNNSSRQRWLTTAILIGLLYFAVGIAFGALAGAAASDQTQFFWRLSAFIMSALVFAVHIAYEHFRLRNRPRSTAWHAAVAVACGGFALALMANIHDLGTAAGYRPRMLIALVAWPLLTGVPAFIVAMVVPAGLKLLGVPASRQTGAQGTKR